MATVNPFDLLDDDAEDVTQLAAAQSPKMEKAEKAAPVEPAKAAKLPSRPLPPAQAVREAKSPQGGGRGGGRGYGRGRGGGFNREPRNNDTATNDDGFAGRYRPSEEGDAVRSERRGSVGGYRGRGGRRGSFSNGEFGDGERPRRLFERRSGTGHGNDFKRDGAGRGNWGTPEDENVPVNEEIAPEDEKNVVTEKQGGEEEAADANKETSADEKQEKEPEEKEMTLEEYEKIVEERRKALQATRIEERKVDKKEFESMQQLSNKKSNDEVFIKLGSEKDKRKDAADKEEKAKKAVSITEFLKPVEGETYYARGGRGRGGRGRGTRGGYGGNPRNVFAPSIEDTAEFPSLGGK